MRSSKQSLPSYFLCVLFISLWWMGKMVMWWMDGWTNQFISLIRSFIHFANFTLVRVAIDLESILGIVGMTGESYLNRP